MISRPSSPKARRRATTKRRALWIRDADQFAMNGLALASLGTVSARRTKVYGSRRQSSMQDRDRSKANM